MSVFPWFCYAFATYIKELEELRVDHATDLDHRIEAAGQKIMNAVEEVGKLLVGQKHLSKRILMALIGRGHILLEGLPGLAKTTAVKSVADVCDLDFSRIQFTPDLLPADVVGTLVYDPAKSEFKTKKGPVFTNLLLADEINRAPAKVQSALLEAMGEKQVTIGDETFKLDSPFTVLATQNPIEQEGTYQLPEAQMDRFFFKVKVGYPSVEEEKEIIARISTDQVIQLNSILSKEDMKEFQAIAREIYVSDKIRDYIVDIIFATRKPADYGLSKYANYVDCGASPRASIALEKLARIEAMMSGRNYVSPQDIKGIAMDVLRHRIVMSYEAEAEGFTSEDFITHLFAQVKVP